MKILFRHDIFESDLNPVRKTHNNLSASAFLGSWGNLQTSQDSSARGWLSPIEQGYVSLAHC